jgi:hypothetical protein
LRPTDAVIEEADELLQVAGAAAETLGMPEGILVSEVLETLGFTLPWDLAQLTPASVWLALQRYWGTPW